MNRVPNQKDLMRMELEAARVELGRAHQAIRTLQNQLQHLEAQANAQLAAMMQPLQIAMIARDLYVHGQHSADDAFRYAEYFDGVARRFFEIRVKPAAEAAAAAASASEPSTTEEPTP